jgi:hypothetical protein
MNDLEYGIDTDYKINEEIISSEVKMASAFNLLIVAIGSIFLTLLFSFYLLTVRFSNSYSLQENFYISIILSMIVFVSSIIGGLLWRWIGYKIATITYELYLFPDKTVFHKIFAYVYFRFVEINEPVYFEAKAKDPDFNNFKNRIELITNLTLTEVSFFILALVFLSRPLLRYIINLIPSIVLPEDLQLGFVIFLSIAFSVCFMAFYFPASYITQDSNIRTWNYKDLKISKPLASLKRRIDGIIGIGALSTGWGIYSSYYYNSGYFFTNDFFFLSFEGQFLKILDYIIWILSIVLIFWPLSVPAVIVYFYKHEFLVNRYRTQGMKNGVKVGVTHTRPPNSEELSDVKKYVDNLS